MDGRRAVALLAVAAALAGSQLTASSRAGAGSSLGSLRAADATLASRSRSVALELYGLESALTRARAEAEVASVRLEDVRREAADTQRQLVFARRTLGGAQRRLADRLRALYVQGETDPIEVLLGARSLDEAIARVDGLEAIAAHDRAIVRSTTAARARLTTLRERLAAREETLARAADTAAARAEALERTAAERRAYLASLAQQRRLGAARIAALERAAAARAVATATAAAATVSNRRASAAAPLSAGAQAAAPAAAPPPAPAPAPAPVAAAGRRTITVSSTGYALTGTTATGVPVGWGVVAVDPAVIPLGTRLTIPGYGEGVAADTGGAVQGAVIDLWFPSVAQARAWGRRTVTVTLH